MNHRILMALTLAGALALPALAQQSSGSQPQSNPPAATDQAQPQSSSQQPAAADQAQPQSSSQQPAAPSTTTSSSDQTQAKSADQLQPLTYEKHEGFWGHLNPFARKKYVQRQLNPVRDRLNELDELTAGNSKAIKDVDSRATEGIRLASAKANEADQHAVDAGNRAQLASQTAQQANDRLGTVQKAVANVDQFQSASQGEIRFRPGQTALSKKAKDAIDEMATPVKDQKGYVVEVQGFSSGRGQAAIANSQEMANSVVRYLVENENIPVYRIYKVGMGNAPIPASEQGKAHRVHGGRVEISLLKNGIGDLGTESASTSNGTPATSNNNGSMPQSDQSVPASAPASSNVGSTPAANSQSTPQTAPQSKPAPAQQQPPANEPPPPPPQK